MTRHDDWVDAVQQPNLAAGGNGGGGTYRVTIPHGTYGDITYTIVGAGGGSAPVSDQERPEARFSRMRQWVATLIGQA